MITKEGKIMGRWKQELIDRENIKVPEKSDEKKICLALRNREYKEEDVEEDINRLK